MNERDPYETLGVTSEASPKEIRTAYLEKVREFPPERDAASFALIRQAYERLCDPMENLSARLFVPAKDRTIPDLFVVVAKHLSRTRPTTSTLRKMVEAIETRERS